MKKMAWFAVFVWVLSLWFLYPFPFQEIEMVERVQGNSDDVTVEIWVRWFIATCHVLFGLYIGVRFLFDTNRSPYVLVILSLVYVGYFFVHFYRASLAFDVSLPEAFMRQWESAVSLDTFVAQLGFMHAYVVLPVSHLLIATIFLSIVWRKRRSGAVATR